MNFMDYNELKNADSTGMCLKDILKDDLGVWDQGVQKQSEDISTYTGGQNNFRQQRYEDIDSNQIQKNQDDYHSPFEGFGTPGSITQQFQNQPFATDVFQNQQYFQNNLQQNKQHATNSNQQVDSDSKECTQMPFNFRQEAQGQNVFPKHSREETDLEKNNSLDSLGMNFDETQQCTSTDDIKYDKGGRAKRKRHRNMQQQQQNKMAQQRYRERRKQQVVEMQTVLDDLQAQLEFVNEEKMRIQAQNEQRSQKIKELEEFVARKETQDKVQEQEFCSILPKDIQAQKYALKKKIQSLMDNIMSNQGQTASNVSDDYRRKNITQCITQYVQVQTNTLKCIQRLQTVQFGSQENGFYGSAPRNGNVDAILFNERQIQIKVDDLVEVFVSRFQGYNLPVPQISEARTQLVEKLKTVYQDRLNLYVKVGQGMFNQMLSNPSVDSKVEQLKTQGFMQCQKAWLQGKEVLKIQDNLNLEYEQYSEFCVHVLSEIFTFDQALFLMNATGENTLDLMHFCTQLVQRVHSHA